MVLAHTLLSFSEGERQTPEQRVQRVSSSPSSVQHWRSVKFIMFFSQGLRHPLDLVHASIALKLVNVKEGRTANAHTYTAM